jgi:hypothetical protein
MKPICFIVAILIWINTVQAQEKIWAATEYPKSISDSIIEFDKIGAIKVSEKQPRFILNQNK